MLKMIQIQCNVKNAGLAAHQKISTYITKLFSFFFPFIHTEFWGII